MGVVIKRDQRRQAFSGSKIKNSIQKAAKEAGYSALKIKDLINDVAQPTISHFKTKRSIRASAIRKSILGRLDRRAKSVSASWRRHDKRK